jgi:hypothetical protein
MKEKWATKLRDIPRQILHSGVVRQSLYRLDPPHQGFEHVIASAARHGSIHETLLFPANMHGEIVSYSELRGSMRNTTSHAEVLARAGYRIVELN